nr:HisA/HisF-related TIM barrel protein [Anaerostipes caccae]
MEGKGQGIDEELVRILGSYMGNPVTYAGGIKDFADLELIKREGRNRVDVTVGSALDLFGGPMEFERVLGYCD